VASDCDDVGGTRVGDMARVKGTDESEREDCDAWLAISSVEAVDGITLDTCSGNATCWNRVRDAAANES
jgi:hypothetical protein